MQRYANPLITLVEAFHIKALVSAGAAALATLFHHSIQYAMLVALLVVIDFATGIIAAKKRGEKITSLGLRQTIIKALEYMCFLVAVTAFANVFTALAGWISATAYFYIAATECASIAENTLDNPAIRKAWEAVKDRFQPPSDPPLAGA